MIEQVSQRVDKNNIIGDSMEATSEPSKGKNVGIGHRGNTCMCLPGVC